MDLTASFTSSGLHWALRFVFNGCSDCDILVNACLSSFSESSVNIESFVLSNVLIVSCTVSASSERAIFGRFKYSQFAGINLLNIVVSVRGLSVAPYGFRKFFGKWSK
jgi:hypothetical protein